MCGEFTVQVKLVAEVKVVATKYTILVQAKTSEYNQYRKNGDSVGYF